MMQIQPIPPLVTGTIMSSSGDDGVVRLWKGRWLLSSWRTMTTGGFIFNARHSFLSGWMEVYGPDWSGRVVYILFRINMASISVDCGCRCRSSFDKVCYGRCHQEAQSIQSKLTSLAISSPDKVVICDCPRKRHHSHFEGRQVPYFMLWIAFQLLLQRYITCSIATINAYGCHVYPK